MEHSPEDVTMGELYRAIAGLRDEMRDDVADVKESLTKVVYQDVFESEMRRVEQATHAARAIAWWSLGVMIGAMIGALAAIIVALNSH